MLRSEEIREIQDSAGRRYRLDCQYLNGDWSAMLIAPLLLMKQQELWSQSSILSWDTMAKEGVLMKCPRYR
jgi:hypothetical protein